MLDQSSIESLAAHLVAISNPTDVESTIAKYYTPDWPDTYVNSDTHKPYTPHNENEYRFVYSDSPLYTLCKGGEGAGKALALDTPLPTPTGWTTMGEIQAGDSLFDERGEVCRVIAVSLVMHDHDCYEMIFSDGQRIVADAEHLWLTADFRTRKSLARRGEKYVDGSMAHLPHCQPQCDPELRTTEEILHTLRVPRGDNNHSIRLAEPLRLPPADLPIDPWLLGVWLGDGTARAPHITIGYQDQDEMIALIEAVGHRVVRHRTAMQFGIDTSPRHNGTNSNPFWACIRNLNLVQNKHIPPIYLRGSYVQRLAFLQGLMDTDGCISPSRGRCEYGTISERLATGVEELCISLGIKTKYHKSYKTVNGEPYAFYRLGFKPHAPMSVFRLSRKAKFIRPPGAQSVRQLRRYIVDVRPYVSVPVKCVVVDSPSHLFLVGKGMIPTHNSVAGIVKTLNRLRKGVAGVMVSPDLPHFRRSLWPEFRRWCPWDQVVPEQRYRSKFSWEPRAPFSIAFLNGATLLCGGIDDPGAWEGPNISFAYIDEARRKKTSAALKVLSGRVRIPGPNGEPPQLYITTTPRKHWLYEYFGPLQCKCDNCSRKFEHEVDSTIPVVCPHCTSTDYSTDDPRADFKLKSLVITLLTLDNESNLSADFTANRALSLSSAEARVLLEAMWEDTEGGERFLPSMLMWDTCKEDLPPLTKREPLVLAMDAATGRSDSSSDCFGIVGVTRHPDPERRGDSLAVRFVQKWQAKAGQKINFRGTERDPGPELVVRTLCSNYNVVVVTYDPDQLHDMGERLSRERIAWMLPFTQRALRVKSDTDLLNLIVHRRLAHDGDPDLRDHVSNADRKLDDAGKRLRIVKREESLKIDLCVCLSMASLQALRLNL